VPERHRSPGVRFSSTLCRKAVMEQLRQLAPGALVIFTGGEPLLRPDLEELGRAARSKGFTVVVGTNGLLLTPERLQRLRAAGVQGVALSLDSLDAEVHDGFRGRRGAWQATLANIDNLAREGFPFVLQTTVTRANLGELRRLTALAAEKGAGRVGGRGGELVAGSAQAPGGRPLLRPRPGGEEGGGVRAPAGRTGHHRRPDAGRPGRQKPPPALGRMTLAASGGRGYARCSVKRRDATLERGRGAMLGRLGPAELAIIAGVVLLVFGPARLPQLGRSLGRTLREFRGAAREITTELDEAKRAVEEPAKALREPLKEVGRDLVSPN